jgi:tRNA threonylcarbamoyladenosine biosynthesis protein TsaB
MILGIDCATSIASAALVRSGQVLADVIYPPGGSDLGRRAGHAEILLPLIESVLERTGRALGDLRGIALTVGPGSFTGVRIGLSTVQGLVYGSGIPTEGISTLWANARRVIGRDGLVCPLLDARKGEVYTALFRRDGQALARLAPDAVLPVEEALERVQVRAGGEPCLFIGDGVQRYDGAIRAAAGDRFRPAEEGRYPSAAAAAALLGELRLRVAEPRSVSGLTPVYLRRSEAETKRPESL